MSADEFYSDEALHRDMESGAPGPKNSAPYFLKLDTVERRLRASSEAHTLTNLLGFRRSEAVAHAVHALLENIARGQEDAELYGEKVAREDRERENERKANMLRAAGAEFRRRHNLPG